ncbi:MAG: (Fe-S)-binding protein [Methanophagales archaeon]|nr:(Fe-S)-binding protein [Methanophagales archaeon]
MNEEILRVSRLCYQCGECTGACPLRRVSKFSPRSFVYNILAASDSDKEEISPLSSSSSSSSHSPRSMPTTFNTDDQWNCLICDNCYLICPQDVDFPTLILNLRREGEEEDSAKAKEDILAHRIFSEIATFMTSFDKGVPTDFKGETDEESEYGYFPGCLDYLDLFMDVGVNYHEIGDYAIKLLNEIGIKPRIVSLKCCGHDVLYQGNYKIFEQLASYNTEKIKELGIKKLVVSCAECFLTFKKYYELESMGVEVIHISQLLSERMEFSDVEKAHNRAITVTYHDSCALKRFQLYEAPRDAIKKSGVKYVELTHSKDNSLCCGVSGMMNCNDMSKALRAFRLSEVKEKEVDVLITTCPKCLSHFSCLKHESEKGEEKGKEGEEGGEKEEKSEYEGEYNFEIVDLAVFLGRLLELEGRRK